MSSDINIPSIFYYVTPDYKDSGNDVRNISENKTKDMRQCVCFDMDDTLVSKSMNLMYSNVKDKLHELVNKRCHIIIISNQKRRAIGDQKLMIRLNKLHELLQIPFIAYC